MQDTVSMCQNADVLTLIDPRTRNPPPDLWPLLDVIILVVPECRNQILEVTQEVANLPYNTMPTCRGRSKGMKAKVGDEASLVSSSIHIVSTQQFVLQYGFQAILQ